MKRSSFAQADLARATAAFNRVFEAYVVPMSFSEAQFAIHLDANQIDGDASPIWYDEDGSVLAAATLAIRGSRGWVGGFGIAPPYRGRGYGALLIDHLIETARNRALSSVSLEVLEQNIPAVRTYERAGFTRMRELRSFRCDTSAPSATRSLPPYTDPDPLLRVIDDVAPCWQREAPSLMLQPSLHAVGDAARFAVFRHNGVEAQILKMRAQSPDDVAALAAGIATAANLTAVGIFNEPSESTVVAHLRDLGWTPTFTQHEMIRCVDKY